MNRQGIQDVYSVGIATGDITPEVGAPLCGFSSRGLHTSTGVYHPLRTVAAAICDGRTAAIILSAEIIYFGDISKRVRDAIRQETGIAGANIILSGTHTHCGPGLRAKDIDRFGWIDHDYVNRAVSIMAKTAAVAWKHRFDARLKFGTVNCDFAVSRRKPDPENPGKVLWAPHPQGPHDHEVSVLSMESLDGVPRGILFSYACHPTSRGGLQIGGGYPGFAYDRIQEVFLFAQPSFLQGCGADQKPAPHNPDSGRFTPRTIEQVRDIGTRMGDAVIKVIESGGMQPVTGAMDMRQSVISLFTEPVDKNLVANELKGKSGFRKRWAQYHMERMNAGLPEEREAPFEIQTLVFGGSLAVVTLAAEAVVEYALRFKRDLRPRFSNVLPLAYTNDVIGYIPVKRQFNELGYEVLYANLMKKRTGRFTEATEEHVHDAVKSMLAPEEGAG